MVGEIEGAWIFSQNFGGSGEMHLTRKLFIKREDMVNDLA